MTSVGFAKPYGACALDFDTSHSNISEGVTTTPPHSTMTSAQEGDKPHSAQNEPLLVEDLLQKCQTLLNEVQDFWSFLVQCKKEHTVEIRQFRNSVQSELKSISKVCSLISHPQPCYVQRLICLKSC